MTSRAARPRAARAAAPASRALRSSILRWYRRHRRDLPWRRTRDPYAIWVSEVMLQQTRVETVIPYYERFLARFPTVGALARARESDVLALWSGLGYYGRARSLKAAAGLVAREHAGRLPEDGEALRALPGVGAYTAAAIASVAFGRPEAAVDGNVIRVLARIAGRRGRRDSPALRREVQRFAGELARGPSPGDWAQALMELGALVCAPRAPRCDECPAAAHCVAHRSGDPARFPSPAKKAAALLVERRVLLVALRGDRVLLTPGATSSGAWTLPHAPIAPADSGASATRTATASARDAARRLARTLFATAGVSGPRGSFRHRTYSEDQSFEIWQATPGRAVRRAAPRAAETGRAVRRDSRGAPAARPEWIERSRLREIPLRSPTLKALKALRLL